MAVLNHFAACGWALEQIEKELAGQFPGLAALYGTPSKRARLLATEWAKAQAFTKGTAATNSAAIRTTEKTALINDTSLTKLTGGAPVRSTVAIHQLCNDLENILYAVLDYRLREYGREGLSLRLLLRGLLSYMRAKETNLVDVGCRSLALVLGKHHATVARLLPVLVKATDGILTKVADARRKSADVYLLQIPPHFEQLARELSWRKGKIHAVRPVFRALGDVAALVYEAIERGRHSPTTAEIVRSTGLSRNAVACALADMEAIAMISRNGRCWKITSVSLSDLAARVGALEDYQAHISRNRRERAAWHAFLDRFEEPGLKESHLEDVERDEYWLPPDDAALWWAA